MNAAQARALSRKTIEEILWNQLNADIRSTIIYAVGNDMQQATFNVEHMPKKGINGVQQEINTLKMLGYHVSDDGCEDRGPKDAMKNIFIHW